MLRQIIHDELIPVRTIRGVAIFGQPSLALMPLWAAVVGIITSFEPLHGAAFMVAFVFLLYALAGLHELGHIAVARRHGAAVRRIRVSGMGAFVQLDTREGFTARQEIAVALGGPAVSAAISVILIAAVWPAVRDISLDAWPLLLIQRDLRTMLLLLAVTNVSLTLFNLLPVLPMDGGRALVAALGGFLAPPRAVQVVSVFGQVVALATVPSTFFLTDSYLLLLAAVLTGALVFLTARGGGQAVNPAPETVAGR